MSNHQPAVDPPSGRRTHRPKKVTATVLASALLVAALAPLAAQPAQAELAAVGPIDPATGYPAWYSDGTVRLKLCLDPAEGCLAELPDPGAPIAHPTNFPGEAFWFAAEASGGNLGLYEAALEAAHTTEEATAGEQIAFARLRFRLTGLTNGASYTITHPYGVHTFTAAAGGINVTIDEGDCAVAPCNFDLARAAFLGDFGGPGTTATFLRQVGAADGTIGSINASLPVTGAPSGNNFVRVDGPNAGGPGINTLTVDRFAIQGVVSTDVDGAPSTPDLATVNDSGRSSADNITNVTTPTFTGTATAGSSVELVVDGVATGVTATATDGTYSLTPTVALGNGAHRIIARINGTPNLDSAPLAITVDAVAPAATIDPPVPSSPSADNTPTFNFSSNEAGSTFECALSPNNAAFAPCTSPKTWDAQVSGTHTFSVRATDTAGNVGAATTSTIQIGTTTTPPPVGTAETKDMTSDGNPDVVARDSAGVLWLYRGNGNGGFQPRTQIGTGWNIMSAILQPGDWNGDGRADLMARDSSGALWLYRGNGAGGVAPRVQIGAGWNVMTAIVTPGDFNGDARADLIARDSSGRLFLYPGNGTGGFTARSQIGSGWNVMTSVLSPGDWNGDGRADVMARDGDGRLFLYPGNGRGGFAPRSQPGAGWNVMTAITGAGHWDAGTTADLLARDSSGRLWLYRGGGAGGFGTRTQIGAGWNGYTIVQ